MSDQDISSSVGRFMLVSSHIGFVVAAWYCYRRGWYVDCYSLLVLTFNSSFMHLCDVNTGFNLQASDSICILPAHVLNFLDGTTAPMALPVVASCGPDTLLSTSSDGKTTRTLNVTWWRVMFLLLNWEVLAAVSLRDRSNRSAIIWAVAILTLAPLFIRIALTTATYKHGLRQFFYDFFNGWAFAIGLLTMGVALYFFLVDEDGTPDVQTYYKLRHSAWQFLAGIGLTFLYHMWDQEPLLLFFACNSRDCRCRDSCNDCCYEYCSCSKYCARLWCVDGKTMTQAAYMYRIVDPLTVPIQPDTALVPIEMTDTPHVTGIKSRRKRVDRSMSF